MRLRLYACGMVLLLTATWASSTMAQGPSFSSFTPESGSPGALVKIIGARLDLVTAVRFHGVMSPSVQVVSPEHLKAVVPDGATTGPIELLGPGGVSIELDRPFYVALPSGATPPLYLSPPRPSPSPGTATLAFSLSAPAHAKLSLFDVRGRLVRVVVDADLPAGPQEFLWGGSDGQGHAVANGVYFVQLQAGAERLLSRFALIRR